jgi:hypothetical protein
LRSVWRHLEERVTDVLERVFVSDLLRAEQRMSEHLAALWPRADATAAGRAGDSAFKELTIHE